MPGLFSRLKHKDGKSKKKGATADSLDQQPAKPAWTDAWTRTSVEPEEIHELVKRCTEEIKTRGTTPIYLAAPARDASLQAPIPSLIRPAWS